MKKVMLAVLIAMVCSLPVRAQYVGGTDMATAANKSLREAAIEGGCIEGLLKHTGYSSAELSETLETAWSYYRQGWCNDINAVDRGGNTILHLIVRGTPDQWPTKLDQWIKAGVRDVPNGYGKTALQELEEDMKRIKEDNRFHGNAFSRRVPVEYDKAHKVLENTPQEKQRRAEQRRATRDLFLQALQNEGQVAK